MAYWRYVGNLAVSGSMAGNNYINDSGTPGFPSNGDDIEFGPNMLVPVTTGYDGLAAVTGVAIFFKPGHLGIGDPANYAQVQANMIDDTGGGSAQCYLVNLGGACQLSATNGPTGAGVLALAGDFSLVRGVGQISLQFNRDPNYLVSEAVTTVEAGAIINIGAAVVIGTNVTVGGGTIRGGSVTSSSNVESWDVNSGTLTILGSATKNTINNYGGTVNDGSTGALNKGVNRTGGVWNKSANASIAYNVNDFWMDGGTSVFLGRPNLDDPILMLSAGAGPTFLAGTQISPSFP